MNPGQRLTIITGASAGIGAALADEASRAGDVVATISRRPGPGEHLACDLSDPGRWSLAVEWMDALIGSRPWAQVTAIHNAGTLDPIGFAGDVDPAAYATNVLLNSAAPQVIGNGIVGSLTRHGRAGLVMMISSGAGKNPYPGWSSYCAGKAATDMWVRTAGVEQAERGAAIKVVSVAPGVVATDMQAAIRASTENQFPTVARFRTMHEQGALSDPADVARQLFALTQVPDEVDNGAVLDVRDLPAS